MGGAARRRLPACLAPERYSLACVGNSVIILGIETSCDETAAAVVEDGWRVLSSSVASQIELHRRFGGVVPEIASRQHVEAVNHVIEDALANSGLGLAEVDGIAVTNGPGLEGALLVGACAAKGLAVALGVPLTAAHHIEAHVYANFLERHAVLAPFLCLVVSGGHADLVLFHEHGRLELVGETRDDAPGEAFDKVARLLGLPYPGGPEIDQIAAGGNPAAIAFPRPRWEGSYDYSFSGLKTAAVRYVERLSPEELAGQLPDICASFQEAVVDVLLRNLFAAAEEYGVGSVCLGGGVAANSRLRARFYQEALARGLCAWVPPSAFCLDNAAMVAAGGYYRLAQGLESGLDFDVFSVGPLSRASL